MRIHGIKLLAAASVSMLLSLACGGGGPGGLLPGGSSSSSGSGGPEPLTERQAIEQYFAATCDYEERCANTRGRANSSKAGCTQGLADTNALFLAYYGKDYYDTYLSWYNMVDEAKARGCIDLFKTIDCAAEFPDDNDCQNAFEPINERGENQVCGGTDDVEVVNYCGDDLYCDAVNDNQPDCTICKVQKNDGVRCDAAFECKSRFCGGGENDGTCGPPAYKEKNQPCARNDQCLGALECTGIGDGKACSERGSVGVECDGPEQDNPTNPTCYSDLDCLTDEAGVEGTCAVALADGQTCQRDTGGKCAHLCKFAAGDDETGTCAPYAGNVPAAGQPCASLGNNPYFCAQGLYPEIAFEIVNNTFEIQGCTCATPVENGGGCHFSWECNDEARCDGANFQVNPPTEGQCDVRLGNGEQCFDNLDCASEYCEPVSAQAGECAAKPECP